MSKERAIQYGIQEANLFGAIASHQTYKAIALITQDGIDLNAINFQGQTFLHCAVIQRNQVVVEGLIQAGVRLDIIDNKGFTPLQHAYATHNQSIINLLGERHIALLVELNAQYLTSSNKIPPENVINLGSAEEVNNSKGHKLEKEEIKQEDNQDIEQVPSQEIENGGNRSEPDTTHLLEQAAFQVDEVIPKENIYDGRIHEGSNNQGIEGDPQNNQYPSLDSAQPSLLAKIFSFAWVFGRGAKVDKVDDFKIIEIADTAIASSANPAPVAQPKTAWWNPFSWITSWRSGKGATAENQDHGGIAKDESFVAIKDMFSLLEPHDMNADGKLTKGSVLVYQPEGLVIKE